MLGLSGKRSMTIKLLHSRKRPSSFFFKSAQLNLQRFLWLFFIILLVACGTVSPKQAGNATSTSAPTFTPITPTASEMATITPYALPDTPTPATLGLVATPVPGPLPLFPLDGYVMVFVKNGDLYFQDGTNSPVELTHVGNKSSYHAISDDNQKVIFSRGDGNIYSINSDGSREETIISKILNKWPQELIQPGIVQGIEGFVPGTHEVLFETVKCESEKFESPCSMSLFLADTDTVAIRKLRDFGLSAQLNSQSRTVEVSPNGRMVAVGTADGMDIVTMDGMIIRHNILPYKPSTSTVLFPSLFWLPDSSGLIVALPNAFYDSNAFSHYPASTLWRYTIDENIARQIPVDPEPPGDNFRVSPDGKWIVYGGIGTEGKDVLVFLGDLADGHVQVVGQNYSFYFFWSPDSKHFISSTTDTFLGAVDVSSFIPIYQVDHQWIDARHFLCWQPGQGGPRPRMAEIDSVGAVQLYDLGIGEDAEESLLIKAK